MGSDEKVQKVDQVASTASGEGVPAGAPPSGPLTAAASRAQGMSAARELDPGKSTRRGGVDYVDGATDITDADTVVDISKILAQHNRGQLKLEQMAGELRELGYDVQITSVNGKKAVRFANGDVFVDTSGDGQLGTEDVNFSKALSRVESRFGIDLSSLKSTMEVLDLRDRLKKKAGEMGTADAWGLLGAQGDALAAIRQKLRQADADLGQAGYDGLDDAFSLWKKDELEPVLTGLGLPAPEIPRAADLAFGDSLDRLTNLTQLAYDLATALKEKR